MHQLIQNEWYLDRKAPKTAHLGMRILDCMDLSELPAFAREQRAGEVATCIKEILDREELPPWEEIPDLDMIEAKGGFEKLSRWRVPGTRITIARVEEGPQRHEYLFTAGTVNRARGLFQANRISALSVQWTHGIGRTVSLVHVRSWQSDTRRDRQSTT